MSRHSKIVAAQHTTFGIPFVLKEDTHSSDMDSLVDEWGLVFDNLGVKDLHSFALASKRCLSDVETYCSRLCRSKHLKKSLGNSLVSQFLKDDEIKLWGELQNDKTSCLRFLIIYKKLYRLRRISESHWCFTWSFGTEEEHAITDTETELPNTGRQTKEEFLFSNSRLITESHQSNRNRNADSPHSSRNSVTEPHHTSLETKTEPLHTIRDRNTTIFNPNYRVEPKLHTTHTNIVQISSERLLDVRFDDVIPGKYRVLIRLDIWQKEVRATNSNEIVLRLSWKSAEGDKKRTGTLEQVSLIL